MSDTGSSSSSPGVPGVPRQHAVIDRQHVGLLYRPSEVDHRYGDRVHILSDPLALTMLARLCRRETIQPEINRLVGELYRSLLHAVVSAELPRRVVSVETRMIDATPAGVWTGETVDVESPVVCVALARAGLLPSQVAFDFLNQVLDPRHVRQDHLHLGRTVDSAGHVTGAGLDAAKIGGTTTGATMLIPDPMGATGSTVSKVLGHYRDKGYGEPARVVAAHLIVTPEYLRHVCRSHPEVTVYALRLDRGLSAPDVLDCVPGERWDEERGLNEHQYIVPGAGGLGEIMNNSFV